jgi:hypothetical protein
MLPLLGSPAGEPAPLPLLGPEVGVPAPPVAATALGAAAISTAIIANRTALPAVAGRFLVLPRTDSLSFVRLRS